MGKEIEKDHERKQWTNWHDGLIENIKDWDLCTGMILTYIFFMEPDDTDDDMTVEGFREGIFQITILKKSLIW